MDTGICLNSVIPVRATPSEQSEMVTQFLFGETFTILEKYKEWSNVSAAYDHYIGWVDNKQITTLSPDAREKLNPKSYNAMTDLVQLISETSNNHIFPIVLGSSLPVLDNEKGSFDSYNYTYEGRSEQIIFGDKNIDPSRIIENAYMYLNAPYLWGGRSPFGIDCSGFTQMVYKLSGIKIDRDASLQSKQGVLVNDFDSSNYGDLAFFSKKDGRITHVGIILKDNKIIHASGKVRIDRLDNEGILNDENVYTHHLHSIKRVVEN